MCRPGGRRCPGQYDPAKRAAVNAKRKAQRAARKNGGDVQTPAVAQEAPQAQEVQEVKQATTPVKKATVKKATAKKAAVKETPAAKKKAAAEKAQAEVDKKQVNLEHAELHNRIADAEQLIADQAQYPGDSPQGEKEDAAISLWKARRAAIDAGALKEGDRDKEVDRTVRLILDKRDRDAEARRITEEAQGHIDSATAIRRAIEDAEQEERDAEEARNNTAPSARGEWIKQNDRSEAAQERAEALREGLLQVKLEQRDLLEHHGTTLSTDPTTMVQPGDYMMVVNPNGQAHRMRVHTIERTTGRSNTYIVNKYRDDQFVSRFDIEDGGEIYFARGVGGENESTGLPTEEEFKAYGEQVPTSVVGMVKRGDLIATTDANGATRVTAVKAIEKNMNGSIYVNAGSDDAALLRTGDEIKVIRDGGENSGNAIPSNVADRIIARATQQSPEAYELRDKVKVTSDLDDRLKTGTYIRLEDDYEPTRVKSIEPNYEDRRGGFIVNKGQASEKHIPDDAGVIYVMDKDEALTPDPYAAPHEDWMD